MAGRYDGMTEAELAALPFWDRGSNWVSPPALEIAAIHERVKAISAMLAPLLDADRETILHSLPFCYHCGSSGYGRCYCQADD